MNLSKINNCFTQNSVFVVVVALSKKLVLAQSDHSLGACNVRATVTLLIYN